MPHGDNADMDSGANFSMPEASWEAIKKIIRAYRAAEKQDSPTVEGIAKLAGMQRTALSMNNNFLRSIGIVEMEQNRLTAVGMRLAAGLAMESAGLVTGAIESVSRGNEVLSSLLSMVDARGSMSVQDFKAELILLAGLNEKSRQVPFVKTILDMMQEGRVLQVADDTITLVNLERQAPDEQRSTDAVMKVSPTTAHLSLTGGNPTVTIDPPRRSGTEVPLALGPSRLVYVILPPDWDAPKDLRKFLKLAELALGDEPIE